MNNLSEDDIALLKKIKVQSDCTKINITQRDSITTQNLNKNTLAQKS